MKRFHLCLFFIILCSPFAFAQEPTLSFPHVTAFVGQEIEIPVEFSNLEDVFAFRVVIDLPNTSTEFPLEYIPDSSSIENASTSGWLSIENDASTVVEPPPSFPGAVLINGSGSSALNGNGVLVHFRVRVKDDAVPQVVPLTFRTEGRRPTSLNDGGVPVEVVAGSITIGLPGTPTITPTPSATPTPTPSSTQTPTPTLPATPTPTFTPTLTPTPAGSLTVRILDRVDSSHEVTGLIDYDDPDDKRLALAWDLAEIGVTRNEVENVQVYVRVNQQGGFLYLGRTSSGQPDHLEWRRNGPRLARDFRGGPDYNTEYEFQVYVILRNGNGTLGPFAPSASVRIQPIVTLTDSVDTTFDLSGGTDVDPAGDKQIVIRWVVEPDEMERTNIEDFHVYVRESRGAFRYLGRGGNAFATYLSWEEGNPLITPSLRSGPFFNGDYEFRVYAIARNRPPRFYGPFEPDGSLQYQQGIEQPTPTTVPTATPTSTPTPPAGALVQVLDNEYSSRDLVTQIDYDSPNANELFLRWDQESLGISEDDVRDFHVYVSDNDFTYQYLGRTGQRSAESFSWRRNAPRLNSAFRDGPSIGSSYSFQLYGIPRETGEPIIGPFTTNGFVEMQTSIIVTDDESSDADLSGDADLDTDDDRELVVRWRINEREYSFSDVLDYHVYVSENNGNYRFLGRTRSGDVTQFVWNDEARVANRFRDGPQFDTHYSFRVFAIGFTNRQRVDGPHDQIGAVEFLDEQTTVPTATPTPVLLTLQGQVESLVSGEPISGADIQVGSVSAASNENGDFVIEDVPPGEYSVTVNADGYQTFQGTFVFSESSAFTVRMILDPAAPTPTPQPSSNTVTGLIINARNFQPLAGLQVRVHTRATTTNNAGFFSLQNIPDGIHTITVRGNDDDDEVIYQSLLFVNRSLELIIPVRP